MSKYAYSEEESILLIRHVFVQIHRKEVIADSQFSSPEPG